MQSFFILSCFFTAHFWLFLFFTVPAISTEFTFIYTAGIKHIVKAVKAKWSKLELLADFVNHFFYFSESGFVYSFKLHRGNIAIFKSFDNPSCNQIHFRRWAWEIEILTSVNKRRTSSLIWTSFAPLSKRYSVFLSWVPRTIESSIKSALISD